MSPDFKETLKLQLDAMPHDEKQKIVDEINPDELSAEGLKFSQLDRKTKTMTHAASLSARMLRAFYFAAIEYEAAFAAIPTISADDKEQAGTDPTIILAISTVFQIVAARSGMTREAAIGALSLAGEIAPQVDAIISKRGFPKLWSGFVMKTPQGDM